MDSVGQSSAMLKLINKLLKRISSLYSDLFVQAACLNLS